MREEGEGGPDIEKGDVVDAEVGEVLADPKRRMGGRLRAGKN